MPRLRCTAIVVAGSLPSNHAMSNVRPRRVQASLNCVLIALVRVLLTLQLLLVGDSGVGKSCLLMRFTQDKFDDLSPTIGRQILGLFLVTATTLPVVTCACAWRWVRPGLLHVFCGSSFAHNGYLRMPSMLQSPPRADHRPATFSMAKCSTIARFASRALDSRSALL